MAAQARRTTSLTDDTDIDIDRYLEQGTIKVEQLNGMLVASLAKQHHSSFEEMANELIRDGIAARATDRARNHTCKRGTINTRFCCICRKPMD